MQLAKQEKREWGGGVVVAMAGSPVVEAKAGSRHGKALRTNSSTAGPARKSLPQGPSACQSPLPRHKSVPISGSLQR